MNKQEKRYLIRQMKALREMQKIFIDNPCGTVQCKDCVFGIEMCKRLNILPREHKPYLAEISLEFLTNPQ